MLTSAFPLSANRPGSVCLQGHLAISFSLMPLRVTWSCFYAVMFQSCGWLSGVACIPKVFWSGLLLLLFIYFLRKVHREKCSGCWGKERINSRALSPLHSFSILSETLLWDFPLKLSSSPSFAHCSLAGQGYLASTKKQLAILAGAWPCFLQLLFPEWSVISLAGPYLLCCLIFLFLWA